MMRLRRKNGRMIPVDYSEKGLPESALSGGEIEDPAPIKQALGDMKAQFDISYARTAVSERQAYMFMATLPPVPQADIRETTSLRIAEQVPVDKNQAVFDYEIRNRLPDGRWYVVVTAIEKENLSPLLSLFSEVDISVASVELTSQAVARTHVSGAETTELFVHLSEHESVVAIVNNGVVSHMTAVDCGTKTLLNMTATDQSDYLYSTGFTCNEQTADTYYQLAKALQPVITASRKRVRFWKTEADAKSSNVSKVIITGPGAKIPHVSAQFESALGLKAQTAQPFATSFSPDEYVPEISLEKALDFQTAIGLALNKSN
jgi:Tfp pilus assembly PilM family ATPase